ncbi:MAG TPA: putative toxin-antitoxin system toxin component, PIN family [Thermoanaerobaculia bacterium]|jgi:putative PIN family toxin of toxin-antitoxin system
MGTRVVLDTNVIVSGLGWRGPSHDIVQSCLELQHDLVLSSALLVEIERVLRYPKFHFSESEILEYLTILREVADIVKPDFQVAIVQDDPDDNRVLECALAGGAEVIVSGDRHLLDLAEFEKIPILQPRVFLDRFGES